MTSSPPRPTASPNQRHPFSPPRPTSSPNQRHPFSPPRPIAAPPRPTASPNQRPPFNLTDSENKRQQLLKNYKITIEYKHLKHHAPSGVYLLPSLFDLHLFHGVIFLRRGPYAHAIFQFQIHLPEDYNDINTWPRIHFTSYVYSPHVHPTTGELDLPTAYVTWDPQTHYLVTVLTYLKKIFYTLNYPDTVKANREAWQLARENPAIFRDKVDQCVKISQQRVYVHMEPGCTVDFQEDKPCLQLLRTLMKQEMKTPDNVTRETILECVKVAHHQSADHKSKVPNRIVGPTIV